GFSNNVIQILNILGVSYETVDILQDQELRQGVKEYSNWPTIPQVYINGEFIGGSDIMIELYQKEELQQILAIALAS
ncbi:MAG: glutaredoxin family protein, partial [Microcystis panniformis]